MCRQVIVLHVFTHHAVRAEAAGNSLERVGHHADPALRDAVAAAVVEPGDDLAFEQPIDRLGVVLVLPGLWFQLAAVADRPAVAAVAGLGPPAVEDRAVEAAVQRGFHPAGAGGLHRADGVVEPDVAAGGEHAADVHVVVLEHDHAAAEAGAVGVTIDALCKSLTLDVTRVRLAGEDELHRALRVIQDRRQTLRVTEDQRGTLVRRETPRETDRQRVGVEHRVGGGQILERADLALNLLDQALADEVD